MIRNKLVVIFILLTILTLPIKQTTAAEGIKLTKIKGDVYYKSQGWWIFTGKWQELTDEVRLKAGDKIKTKQDSKAQVTFSKQSRILIKSNSKLQITKNQAGNVDLKRLKLNLGEVIVKFIDQLGGQLEIETPSAVAGVKGTTFKVVVNEQQETRVAVNEGKVAVTNEIGTVTVTKGKEAEVTDEKSQPIIKDNPGQKKGQKKQDKKWIKQTKEWSQKVKEKVKKKEKSNNKNKGNSQSSKKKNNPGKDKSKEKGASNNKQKDENKSESESNNNNQGKSPGR